MKNNEKAAQNSDKSEERVIIIDDYTISWSAEKLVQYFEEYNKLVELKRRKIVKKKLWRRRSRY